MMNVIIARGVSCSGKSTALRSQFKECDILSSDKMRIMLTGDESNQRFNAQVFDMLRQVLTVRLKAGALYTVIDATNLKWKDSYEFVKIAKDAGAEVVVYNFPVLPLDELVARSILRANEGGLFVPEEVLARQLETYTNCTEHYIKQCNLHGVAFLDY